MDAADFDTMFFGVNAGYDYEPSDDGLVLSKERSELYRECAKRGISITVMKAYNNGRLLDARLSPFGRAMSTAQCLQYALDRPAVVACLAGVCTYCGHCMPCSQKIEINAVSRYYDLAKAGDPMAACHYHNLSVHADACVQCGHCKEYCPFHVDATEPDRAFWRELAKCSQEEFAKSGTNGKCIEARKLMIALPESFISYDYGYLLKKMVDKFKEKYGVECFAALHHNKRKTNLHIHMIFAERKRLEQSIEKVATRNMFYDEQGHHVRTKKEILDGDGNTRKGCKIIKKGEVYERKIFTVKDGRFKQESFLDEAKVFYTDLINQMALDDKDRLSIFDKNGPYLATKKIGKNNPKAEEIKADNEIRMEWNRTVDRAIVSGVSETEVVELKEAEITDRVKKSVEQNGNKPELFGDIVKAAILLLKRLIAKAMQNVMDMQNKTALPQQKTTAAVKKSIVEQIKAEQKFVPAETKRLAADGRNYSRRLTVSINRLPI